MTLRHVVAQGEDLSRIAAKYGFRDYQIVYQHPDNAGLRRIRPNPNVIFPGDVVVIPDKVRHELAVSTTKRHRFVVSTPKKRLRLRFLNAHGQPIANADAALDLSGYPPPSKRKTNAQGIAEWDVAIAASYGAATISGHTFSLALSHLNPVADAPDGGLSGAQCRLSNLGYYHGTATSKLDPATLIALWLFQHDHDLPKTGELTSATLERLTKEHGC
jgi:hypothetical protein